MSILKTPKKPREQKVRKLTPEQRAELERIELQAITDFTGQADELESAIGMLRLGHHVGWKVLYFIHSKKTIRRYEEILTGESKTPVRIRELFAESGPSSYRNLAFRVSEKVSNFWKFVSGEATDASADKDQRRRLEA